MEHAEQPFDSESDAHLGVIGSLRESFWIFALAAIAGFAFLLLLGAFTLAEMWKAAVVLGVLAVGWIVHAVRQHRASDAANSRELRRIRERRGF